MLDGVNDEELKIIKEGRTLLETLKRKKGNWIGDIIRRKGNLDRHKELEIEMEMSVVSRICQSKKHILTFPM